MNAVNLIAMMFAAQGAAATQPQTSGKLPDDGGFFWLLQQQVSGNSGLLPLSDGELPSARLLAGLPELALALNPARQVQADSAAGLGVPDGTPAVGQDWTLNELLAALLDSLRAALSQDILRGKVREVPVGSLNDVTFDGDVDLAAAAGQPGATTEAEQILLGLNGAWDRILALLSTKLASQTHQDSAVQATPLRPASGGQMLPAVPWTLRQQAQQLLRPGAAGQLAEATDSGPLLTEPGLAAGLPASVQWFKSVGLLGSRPAALSTGTLPTPISGRLELPDGSALLVRLSETGNSQPDSQQRSFVVSIALPGDSATALTATLTIRSVAPPAFGLPLDGGPAATGLSPVAIAGGGEALGRAVDIPNAQLAGGRLESLISAQAVAGETPTIVPADKTAGQRLDGLPAARTSSDDEGFRVTDQLFTGLKSVPVLKGEVPAAPAHQAAGSTPSGGDWTAQLALNQLGSLQRQPVTVSLQQPNDAQPQRLLPPSDRPLGGDLVQAIAAPVSAEAAAPQLMEFVGSRFETAQYGGLEYLEMAERIMERVATARNAGNGLYNAHLDLNPPSLGKMFVNISVRGDAVALQIAVATPVPKEQLKDSLEALRKSLEDEGLYVVELRVVQVNDEQHSGQRQAGHEQQEQGEQESGTVVKTTPSLRRGIKSTPALGFSPQ